MATIAITASHKLEDYRQAVQHVGGDVRIIDHSMGVDEALRGAEGLLLSGGSDIEPSRYGAAAHASVVDVDSARDDFEVQLVKAARARQLPILAICRGIQLMNVACGGTLVQDIPTEVAGALNHRLAVPPNQSYALAHEVWIEKDSLLSRLMKERLNESDTCEVNSRHHQAVKDLAPGFQVTATAPDGVIEAIEDPALPFCLGVQWHPENFWRTGEFRPLFEGLLNEAEKVRK
jgi:putative glutamine amidotransferase